MILPFTFKAEFQQQIKAKGGYAPPDLQASDEVVCSALQQFPACKERWGVYNAEVIAVMGDMALLHVENQYGIYEYLLWSVSRQDVAFPGCHGNRSTSWNEISGSFERLSLHNPADYEIRDDAPDPSDRLKHPRYVITQGEQISEPFTDVSTAQEARKWNRFTLSGGQKDAL
jgi:hypothetical protein